MKKIVITGSNGYIGRNFIEQYSNKYNIIEIDKTTTKSIDKTTISSFKDVDCIVHLAAISGILNCDKDINETMEDNVFATMKIVDIAKKYKIPLIFASSQAAKTGGNTYAFTKAFGEQYINKKLKNAFILRFSNVYGGKDYLELKTSVVSTFLNNLKNDEPITVNGNGKQKRDFIHVDDICTVIDKCINYKLNKNETIDVGTGISTSIYELAYMIDLAFMVYNVNKSAGVDGNVADIKKLQSYFNFVPDHNKLKEYIKKIKIDNKL